MHKICPKSKEISRNDIPANLFWRCICVLERFYRQIWRRRVI